MKIKLFFGGMALILGVLPASSEMVHLYERVSIDGDSYELSERILEASWRYQTQSAPAIDGYYFVGWVISTDQEYFQRDLWGRAYDAAPVVLYEDTTMTAIYLPSNQDVDSDGLPDGWEMYWFGNLECASWNSDFDNDNCTDGEEFSMGSSPLFFETDKKPIAYGDSSLTVYNPSNYPSCCFGCFPTGALFSDKVEYLRPNTRVDTEAYDPYESGFSCWEINGVQQRDIWGIAKSRLSFEMPNEPVTVVAKVAYGDEDNDNLPDNWEIFWFGSVEKYVANDDPDGDGHTNEEEYIARTNPVMAEYKIPDKVERGMGPVVVYNPFGFPRFDISSEPEGVLFESSGDYVLPGIRIVSPNLDVNSSAFVYWTLDDVVQRDSFGRALDSVSFVVMSNSVKAVAHIKEDWYARMCLYWYGSEDIDEQSDTDGDGVVFIDELRAGSNPLLAEDVVGEPVSYAVTSLHESNLQPYEQMQGAIVDGEYSQIFTSPVAGNAVTSATFGNGMAIWPVVADLNCDGLWDLIVVGNTSTNVFLNVGSNGNPEFAVHTGVVDIKNALTLLSMNSIDKLETMSLDVTAPDDALSATIGDLNQDGVDDLLVSDSEGRIWYYKGSGKSYSLQHKVWGGSFAGFAEGLRIAAVDWEGDGDLDCLAGTADGKLMLLRDPRVGRPTNLKAMAGVDTVVLTWDPNHQSRIRGYRLYRASGESEAFGRIAEPHLPTYRDTPPEIATYGYKVSSVSRFYTSGNSTPIIAESSATDAVRATLGGVTFGWHDVNAKLGERVEVVISIENALNYNVAGNSQSFAYDPEYLRPVEVVRSGITSNVEMTDSAQDGSWNVTMTSGVLPAGSGRFLTFVFETLKEGTTVVGGATVEISVMPRYSLGDVNGDGKVDVDDVRLLAKLKNGNGRKWNEDELKAGDFNGNGRLDNADYQALRALLKDMGGL